MWSPLWSQYVSQHNIVCKDPSARLPESQPELFLRVCGVMNSSQSMRRDDDDDDDSDDDSPVEVREMLKCVRCGAVRLFFAAGFAATVSERISCSPTCSPPPIA